jgi:tetratricopeptide (TPR) repeat protein
MPFKPFLCLFLAFAVLSAKGSALRDTSRKIKTPPPRSSFNSYSFNGDNSFADGVMEIKHDSIVRGLHIIAASFRGFVKQPALLKLLDYGPAEFIRSVLVVDSGRLSAKELSAGRNFLAEFIKSDSLDNIKLKSLDSLLSPAPNTEFVLRLRVMMYSELGGKMMINALDELIKRDPDLAIAYLLKAHYYYDRQDYKNAIKWATVAVKLDPQYVYALQMRGKCYNSLDKETEALADFNRVLALYPLHPEAAYERSNILLDSDKYREAIPGFYHCLLIDRDYGYPAYNLARCYKALEMRDSALYFVGLHIQEYPDDADGYDLKGEILYDGGEYMAAVDFFSSAIKMEPTSEGFYEDRADAYYFADSVDAAMPDYKKALSLDKNRAYVMDRLGNCYHLKDADDVAINYYREAIKTAPDYKYPYVDLDIIYNRQGKYDLGRPLLIKAIAIDSTYYTALGNLGWNYYCTNNYDECITWSYKALDHEPDAVFAMFNIALATLCKGDFEKAKERYHYFYNLCQQKNYKINEGAVDDLRNLVKNNRNKDQAIYIIKNVFNETP